MDSNRSDFNGFQPWKSSSANNFVSISLFQPFGPFLYKCFEEYRRDFLPDGKLSPRLWEEKCQEFYDAYRKANDPKKVKRVVKQTDEEWIESLQLDPLFVGVDVRKELGKAQFWCRENSRQCTRKFFTNWLNKAERTLTAAANTGTRKFVAVTPEPNGWLSWMRINRPDWIRLSDENSGERVPAWTGLRPDERNAIIEEMRKTA